MEVVYYPSFPGASLLAGYLFLGTRGEEGRVSENSMKVT
jgi:hypothetical protein